MVSSLELVVGFSADCQDGVILTKVKKKGKKKTKHPPMRRMFCWGGQRELNPYCECHRFA